MLYPSDPSFHFCLLTYHGGRVYPRMDDGLSSLVAHLNFVLNAENADYPI